VPTPIIHELIPPVPMHEHTIPTFEVESSSTTPNVNITPSVRVLLITFIRTLIMHQVGWLIKF
jgi:hypothetical protein